MIQLVYQFDESFEDQGVGISVTPGMEEIPISEGLFPDDEPRVHGFAHGELGDGLTETLSEIPSQNLDL